MSDVPKIYAAITALMNEGVWVGKNKKGTGEGQNYAFRTIDDVVAFLQPIMAKHKISVIQRVVHQARENYTTGKGRSMVNTRLTVEHQFTCAEDGSFVICTTVGEASDTSDKSANKCLTAALKYALCHTFLIPTREPDRDIEDTDNEANGTPASTAPPTPSGNGRPSHNAMGGDMDGPDGDCLAICTRAANVTALPAIAELVTRAKSLPADLQTRALDAVSAACVRVANASQDNDALNSLVKVIIQLPAAAQQKAKDATIARRNALAKQAGQNGQRAS